MKKKIAKKEMLTVLNTFMKDYKIKEITFGKSHSIIKTKGKVAKSKINKKL